MSIPSVVAYFPFLRLKDLLLDNRRRVVGA